MTLLTVAQFMAAGIFFTVALVHTIIWIRRPGSKVNILFALTAFAGGIYAIAELYFYKATTVETFNTAFKWANSISVVGFVVAVVVDFAAGIFWRTLSNLLFSYIVCFIQWMLSRTTRRIYNGSSVRILCTIKALVVV